MSAFQPPLADLYLDDETAWLDAMAAIVGRRAATEIDWPHLREYLSDMANRDRREVKSRLVVLMAHLLKWEAQPNRRRGSWRAMATEQRQRLTDLASRGVLRAHAEAVLAEAYTEAVELASDETRLPAESFPTECPFDIAGLLVVSLPAE